MGVPAWKTRPIRMVRFDRLGKMLPSDPEELKEHARQVSGQLHANLEWVMGTPGSAPGISYLANFQTEKFQVNPSVGSEDPIRTYVPIAREEGITLFAYLNMHWYAYTFTDEHLDWEQRTADGTGYGRIHPLYGDGTTLCINSGWRDWAFDMIEEAMKTGIDGVFLDGPVVYPGCCYCDSCREKFRAQYGAEIPQEEDWKDPRWKQFLRFRERSMADFMRDAGERVRAVNPEGGVFCNAGNWSYGNAVARNPWEMEDAQDITGAEAFFHLRQGTVSHVLDTSQSAKFLRAGKNPAVVFTHHCLGSWHYIGLPDLEMKRAFYQSAACGAGNWFAVFGHALERQEEKTLAPVAESYGFLSEHEDLYINATSAARTALVHSQATSLSYLSPRAGQRAEVHEEDLIMHTRSSSAQDLKALKQACDRLCGEEFSGFFYGLTRKHIPFDVLRDVDLQAEKLKGYDTVILPNIACLSASQKQALMDFASGGGRVIATFETGLFDEDGNPDAGDFLETLFGVEKVEGSFAPAAFEEYLEVSEAGAKVFSGYAAGELAPRFRMALKARIADDVQALCWLMEPVGQVYASLKPRTEFPGICMKRVGEGYGILIPGTFGESYHTFGFLEYEDLLDGLVRNLPGARAQLETDAPSTVQMELWRQEGRLLLHLVNHSGDMRRPFARVHPVGRLSVTLPGVRSNSVRSVRGETVVVEQEEKGITVTLALNEQYDVLVIDTNGKG